MFLTFCIFYLQAANGNQPSQQPGPSGTCAGAGSSSGNQNIVNQPYQSENTEVTSSNTLPVPLKPFPEPPESFGPCRMIFGELYPKFEKSYLELQRVCPRYTNKKKTNLSGYHILIVRAGDPSTIYMSYPLDNLNVYEVEEANLDSKRKEKNGYFVLGQTSDLSTAFDVYFNNIYQMVTPPDLVKGLPFEYGSTFAVILIFIPPTIDGHAHRHLLNMNRDVYGNAIETEMEEVQWTILNAYLQDLVIYGDTCPIEYCYELLRLLPNGPQVSVQNGVYVPMAYVIENDNNPPPDSGISRCSTGNWPFQIDDFILAAQTPRARNRCPRPLQTTRFDMRGFALQKTAQKIILNVDNFFEMSENNPMMLQQNYRQLTCAAVGLGENTIKKIIKNWKENAIETPGKKRNRPFPVQSRVDNFYEAMIRRIIVGFFKRNLAPLFQMIYDEFMSGIAKAEEDLRNKGHDFESFKMSKNTFRKVLHKLGYRYAKINMRDAILMRPDIVMLRGKYLAEIKKNDESPNPLPVVYVDETWIDPHSRTGKAWVLGKCSNYRERAEFTFARNKVSRGPRIIILNAGTFLFPLSFLQFLYMYTF